MAADKPVVGPVDQLWAIAEMFPAPPPLEGLTLADVRAMKEAFDRIGEQAKAWGKLMADALGIEVADDDEG